MQQLNETNEGLSCTPSWSRWNWLPLLELNSFLRHPHTSSFLAFIKKRFNVLIKTKCQTEMQFLRDSFWFLCPLLKPCTVFGLTWNHSGTLCVRLRCGREWQRPLPLSAVLQERKHWPSKWHLHYRPTHHHRYMNYALQGVQDTEGLFSVMN